MIAVVKIRLSLVIRFALSKPIVDSAEKKQPESRRMEKNGCVHSSRLPIA